MSSLISKASLLRHCAVFCAVSVLAVSAQAAAPTPQQLAAYEQAPEIDRLKLLMHLAKSGEAESVETLLATFPLQGPYAKNRQLFIEGLALKARGKLTQAAAKYRAALASDPSLTLVRAELAQTLVELQEDDSAKHHLQLLAAEAPTEEAALGIRSFIDQVDGRKPYKFSGYVSLAPSSNLNSGSKRDTVYSPVLKQTLTIDDASKAESGIGVAGGVNGAYTKRLGNDFSFIAAGGANVRLYDTSDYNSYGLSQSAEIRRLFAEGYLGLGLVSSQTLENDKLGVSYVSYGPRLSTSLQVDAQNQIATSATYEWRNNLNSKGTEGKAILINGAWTHAYDSTFSATAFASFDRIMSDTIGSTYKTVSGGLSVYKELPFGITTTLTGEVSRSKFDDYSAFALTYRDDTRLTGTVELTKRDLNIAGFAPSLSYTYTNNISNINQFDFDTHAVDFRLTKDF